MSNYIVKNLIRDKDTPQLVYVTLDLDQYCKIIAAKIFCSVNRIEEITGIRVSDDYQLKSSMFDAIGMVKRLPNNISTVGDNNEKL